MGKRVKTEGSTTGNNSKNRRDEEDKINGFGLPRYAETLLEVGDEADAVVEVHVFRLAARGLETLEDGVPEEVCHLRSARTGLHGCGYVACGVRRAQASAPASVQTPDGCC